jgi:hypothetical protein
MPVLAETYDLEEKVEANTPLINQMRYVLYGLSGEYKGKVILDLGCGSTTPQLEGSDFFNDRYFEPWMCRALHHLGAIPVGVDMGKLAGEQFQYFRVDLTKPDSLSCLNGIQVPVANARLLFSSSVLKMMQADPSEMRRNIVRQLEHIVNPEGIFMYSQ